MILHGHTRNLLYAGLLISCLGGCAAMHESPLEVNLCEMPSCARDNLYPIFVASPVDAAHIGGINKLAEHVQACGCRNTELFQLFSDGGSSHLAAQVREIKCCNPQARVMLTGFSSGCVIVHEALCELEQEGICVESVCYIDSFTLRWFSRDPHPNNVGYTSMVYREGNPPPDGVPRSSVYYVNISNHFRVPTHPRTVQIVMSQLCSLGGDCR